MLPNQVNKDYWYSQTFILLEIIKTVFKPHKWHKEVGFMDKSHNKTTKRYLFTHHHEILLKYFEEYEILTTPDFNMYHSLARFGFNMPLMSYNFLKRKEQSEELAKNYDDLIIGYDYGIDIDSLTLKEAWQSANKLKKEFDSRKIAYQLKFSGQRGFHFITPYEYLPTYADDKGLHKLIDKLGNLSYNLKGCLMIDIDDLITDNKRVWKMPYSWDRGNIALPLSDEQFNNFNINMVQPVNVLKNVRIKNRGLLSRTHNLEQDDLINNFEELLKDFK